MIYVSEVFMNLVQETKNRHSPKGVAVRTLCKFQIALFNPTLLAEEVAENQSQNGWQDKGNENQPSPVHADSTRTDRTLTRRNAVI